MFLAGWAFILLGAGLLTSVSISDQAFPTTEYGYQIIMGFGFGINLATVVVAAPLAFSAKNLDELFLWTFAQQMQAILGISASGALCTTFDD